MDALVLGSTVLDCVAVAVLAWLVGRTGRTWRDAASAQREALDRLTRDLGGLVADAERRARALDASLARREQSLRALLAEAARTHPTTRAAAPAGPDGLPRLRLDDQEVVP